MNRDPKYRYIVASLASPVGWWLGRRIGMPGLEIWFALLFPGIALLITDLRLNFRVRERPKIPAHLQTYPEHLPEGEDRIPRLAVMDCLEKIPNLRDARFHQFQGCHNGELARPGANFLSTPGRHVPRLEGNILLISLFVGVDWRPWSDSEIARQLRAVHRAGRWMEREASRWGHEVLVAMPDTYFQVLDAADHPVAINFALEGEDYGPVEPAASIEALILMSRTALKLGFQDAVDLVNFVTTQFPSYSPAWLVHVRCCGRSIAVSLKSTELDGVSLALCYAREASFRGQVVRVGTPDPVTIAHETLHLFGASDKYGRSLAAFIPGWVTRHDIMRLDKRDLKDLKIDRLTASELGWVNE